MPASRAKTIRLIARKELTDLLRDRRTIITALVVPLVSFPLLFSVIGFFASPVSNPSQIAVQNLDGAGSLAANLTSSFLSSPGVHAVLLLPSSNLTSDVAKGTHDVGILIPANFSSSISAGRQGNLTIFYDPANGRALEGVTVIQGVADGFSQRIATQRLLVKNVTKADITPIGINQSPLGSEKESKAILAAGALFPSFLLYFTFLGGFYFMVDDIAGEKERRSLEPLLALPTSRAIIFTGKYLVAFLLSMVTASLGLVGTLFSLTELSSATGGGQAGITIPYDTFPAIFAIVALAALSLSALGFCISTFSKNIREAQQYLSPVFFVFFIPIYFTSFLPQSQISQYAAIPLMGYVVLLRDIIIGQATAFEALVSVAINVAVLLFFVWLGLRLLSSEKVILRAT
jgi:sodium transport system permease protein